MISKLPRRVLGLAVLLELAACGSDPRLAVTAPAPKPAPTTSAASTASVPPSAADEAARARVRDMLARVAEARGITPKSEVASKVLNRAAILARIRAHVDEEVPPEAVENEGEFLTALELIPPDYDFVEGSYKLIQGRIAGFYEPADRTMYLVDDLTEEEAVETLAHELDHALQDQAFDIGHLLKYEPGASDRSAAAHSILEGDATAAMFDVTVGSAFKVRPEVLKKAITNANAAAEANEGVPTPHILQTSLVAPYIDGFTFVQETRKAGGWAAVDAAIRDLPASTEQLLHRDKYASREPPIPVPLVPIAALGPGYRQVVDDIVGEQSLRLMLEEWVPAARAEIGGAGWGGDRYVIARKDGGASGAHALALGWHVIMDTKRDADELAEILEARFGKTCKERAGLGPIVIKRSGRELGLVAGPYERTPSVAHERVDKATRQAGDCKLARAWLDTFVR